MSDQTPPPTPPEPNPWPAAPPGAPSGEPVPGAPLPGPPLPPGPAMGYPQPSSGTPVLGIVAVVLSVFLAPIGAVLGIISIATAKGRTAAKVLGWIALGVGLAISAGLAALIIWAVGSIQGAEHVSNDFVGDLSRNDYQAAYSLTSTAFRQNTPESTFESDFASAQSVLSAPHRVVSSRVNSSTNGGTFTDIVYKIDQSPTIYLEVQLVKQDGNWRIQYLKASDTLPSP